MKLIDLLVKELPSRGGWSFGRHSVYQDWDGEIRVDSEFDSLTKLNLPPCERVREKGRMKNSLPDDAFVTREQYEAALAAAKQPVWNGEGLPPVGAECEWYKHAPNVAPVWQKGTIQYMSESTTVIKTDSPGEVVGHPANFNFRPIRTKAECQRDEFLSYCNEKPVNTYAELYDDIAAHKITGVTLVPTVSQIVRVTEKCNREDAERIVTMLTGGTITE